MDYTAQELLHLILDFHRMTPERAEWSLEAQRENPPRLVRLKQIDALWRAFLGEGAGAEAVGGVVVVRYGANPLEAIKNVKAKIAEITPALPSKAFIDLSKVDRSTVEAFAEQHGFEAFDLSLIHISEPTRPY